MRCCTPCRGFRAEFNLDPPERRKKPTRSDYENKLGGEAVLAVPTPDHYLPLLYVIGARQSREAVTFPVEGVGGGSISMLAVRVG